MSGFKYLVCLLALSSSWAAAGDCQAIGDPITVVKLTNYAPSSGGINGHCGTSKSQYDACAFSLDDHLQQKSWAVMAASPQEGIYSDMYGSVYTSPDFAKELGKLGCLKIFVGDNLDPRIRGSLDIVTKESTGKLPSLINKKRSRTFIPIRRFIKKKPKRGMKRNKYSVAPDNIG